MRPPGPLEIGLILTVFLFVLPILFAIFLVWFMKIKIKGHVRDEMQKYHQDLHKEETKKLEIKD